jgi:hypothetical protein
MCNHCDCSQGMQDHCSILGLMPISFCCENCIGYENRSSCENYNIYAAKCVSSSVNHLKIVSEANVEQQVKVKEKMVIPIIDKR